MDGRNLTHTLARKTISYPPSLKNFFISLLSQMPTSWRMGLPLASVLCSPVSRMSCLGREEGDVM